MLRPGQESWFSASLANTVLTDIISVAKNSRSQCACVCVCVCVCVEGVGKGVKPGNLELLETRLHRLLPWGTVTCALLLRTNHIGIASRLIIRIRYQPAGRRGINIRKIKNTNIRKLLDV